MSKAVQIERVEYAETQQRFGTAGVQRIADRVDLVRVCREFAEREGTTLDEMLWITCRGLMHAAAEGDAKAGALVFSYLAKTDPVRTELDVTVRPGPPVPEPADLANRIERFGQIVRDLRIVPQEIPPPTGVAEDIITELCR